MRTRSALPNLITVCNLFCGFLSIFYATQGRLVPAAWLIVIAAFLDAFDGKIARLINVPSQFGVQFDSLADICSFGVAPAVLMFQYYQKFEVLMVTRWLPFAACFLFLLCGALRLARFNTQIKGPEKEDFSGLPVPPAAATLAAYIVFTQVWESTTRAPHIAISLCAMLAFLMISPFQYPAFPKFTFGTQKDRVRLILAFVAMLLVVFYTEEAFFPIALAFSLSGAARWLFNLITDREVADIRN